MVIVSPFSSGSNYSWSYSFSLAYSCCNVSRSHTNYHISSSSLAGCIWSLRSSSTSSHGYTSGIFLVLVLVSFPVLLLALLLCVVFIVAPVFSFLIEFTHWILSPSQILVLVLVISVLICVLILVVLLRLAIVMFVTFIVLAWVLATTKFSLFTPSDCVWLCVETLD